VADEAGQVKTVELDPEAEARRLVALAQIRQYPDPVLRMQAQQIRNFGDKDLLKLVERMKRLMGEAAGVGLAANQVGVLQRVFVVQPEEESEVRALANPVIVDRSGDKDIENEGCLSLQGVLVPVERDCGVTVEALDEHGEPVRLELRGLAARVVQHELDHLDGILIIDRTTPEGRREALGILRQAAAI
jgi:peptide deformylase